MEKLLHERLRDLASFGNIKVGDFDPRYYKKKRDAEIRLRGGAFDDK